MPPDLCLSSLQVGDRVEYRPIGGAAENVSHTTGEICEVVDEGEVRSVRLSLLYSFVMHSTQMPRYVIRNDNTKKETTYQVCSLVLHRCPFLTTECRR